MIRQSFCYFVIAMVLPQICGAQQQEQFCIQVPGLVAVNASNHSVQIQHNRTNGNQVFGWQDWQVVCNSNNGAVFTLQTDQAFTHTTDSSYKRNAYLFMWGGNGTSWWRPNLWRVTKYSDTTDYAGGDEVAEVRAEVDRARDGEFHLLVVFLEEDFSSLIAGDYELTITGTITPK